MKNIIAKSTVLFLCIFLFNSCNDWEDESYHPGGNNGNAPGMLLKEVRTITGGGEGKASYTYDQTGRIKEVISYSDILDLENYTQTQVTYTSNTNATSVTKMYMGGVVYMTTTSTTQVNGGIISITTEMKMGDQVMSTINSEITFAAPCGISKNVMNTILMGLPPIESTTTYNYTDSNCSYKEYQDGALMATVTNDDKFSPYNTPEGFMMGVVSHNPVKSVLSDGTIETITYTYNENDYPTKAVHTFTGTTTEQNYTEEFTYY